MSKLDHINILRRKEKGRSNHRVGSWMIVVEWGHPRLIAGKVEPIRNQWQLLSGEAMASGLTKAEIEAAVFAARARKGPQIELIDSREPGLRFRAGERSAKWSLLVRLATGQRSRISLGSWPGLGIAEARRAARDKRRQIEEGANPNEERRALARDAHLRARSRRTLLQVLDDYDQTVLAHHRRGASTRRALDGDKGLLRSLASREPHSITRTEIGELLRRRARQSPISANRQLAYAKAFFNWCVSEEILDANPAGTLKRPTPERVRDRYHTLVELRELWSATRELGYPFGYLYRLIIALPMRRDELAAMPVAELRVEGEEPVWVLPSERTKRANALRVPLLPLARSIIAEALGDEARPKNSPFVFSTTGETPVSGFAKGKRRWDEAIFALRAKAAAEAGSEPEIMVPWTLHDLRTTFNTHACELLKVSAPVADRILNHVASATTSKIMRVYNKSELFEERKQALGLWERLLKEQVLALEP